MEETNNSIPQLPEDIMFNILTWLPPETLDGLRYVCKSWFNMITSSSFIDAHLHRSKPGLLILGRDKPTSHLFVTKATKDEDDEITLRDFTARYKDIWATCNGLVLFGRKGECFVANPVTKQVVKLPSLCTSSYVFGMVYKVSTSEYKAIHCFGHGETTGCEILTLGDATWRNVNLSLTRLNGWCRYKAIVSIKDVAHWVAFDNGEQCIVSLNMMDEKLHKTKVPCRKFWVHELSETRGCLSCVGRLNDSYSQFEIWVLEDSAKGDWSKLQRIEMGIPRDVAVAALGNGKIIIFQHNDGSGNQYQAYHVQLKQWRYLEYPDKNTWLVFSHRESLVSCNKFYTES